MCIFLLNELIKLLEKILNPKDFKKMQTKLQMILS